ncbi:PadR family transcriptional regulator [Tsukamurella sp. 8F]|uniref:PadR family transcriptional regulator n=1 Tax=unclassified Tsukamurella TaxID=2633480 RepID=UPI0023B8A3C8|nr:MULTISPECIES: PadR family transcriptional regulator [unclassified Tsukamurella]MDF0530970.1 PadR family transcriptional regulator [Tsukamurella sp. 8J]MDF0588295.1 PadR family transcriptional regulator [Tsukamurella sp. 8F]
MSLRFATLGLLARSPGSGYDLLRRFERSMANVWPATQSQLYGELGRLERDGLIEIVDEGARGRKVYDATESGRAALREWLTKESDTTPRSARLLRVFLLPEADPDAAREFFRREEQHAERDLSHLEEILRTNDWADTDHDFGRIALEYGLRFHTMEIEWARWAQKRLGT